MERRHNSDATINELLDQAGRSWRSRQSFGSVDLSPSAVAVEPTIRSRVTILFRMAGAEAAAAVVVVAIGLGVLAVYSMRPQLPAPAGATSSEQSTSLIAATARATSNAGASSQQPAAQIEATPGSTIEAECAGPQRLARDDALIQPVVVAVNTDKINFGGAYVDSNGVLVVQYVGANAGRIAVDSVLDPRICVRWEKVDRSRAQLDQIMTEIMNLNQSAVGAIAIDTIGNRVEVDVYPPLELAQVSQVLSEYGAAVNVVASAAAPSY